MKKAALYCRVSTVDQHVESQLYDLRQLAEQRGLEVVKEYADKGVSGLKARRPGLDALMSDARQRKFSVVLVAAFDRVARSTRHFLHVMDELDSLGIEFVSRREGVATGDAMGRLFITIISAIAELERSLVVERVKSGMRRARLEVRTAFGRFAGMQISWFDLLNMVGTVAALANLFVDYLATFFPATLTSWNRAIVMAVLIAIPAAANYRGVRTGANLSSLMTLAKLLPLVLLIVFGVSRFAHHPEMIHSSEIASHGLSNWVRAMALLLWAFGGWEDSVLPTGEIREPRRTIPFGLGTGLLGCAVIYTLLQFIVVATIGTTSTDAPLTASASVLLGRGGAAFVVIAALVSIYGWISASMLYAPRLAYSLSAQGDFPAVFARLHSRFHTPTAAIVLYAVTAWALASSGTFLWLVVLTAGTMMILYAGVCASLIRLRMLHPKADAFRIPFGPVLGVVGVAIAFALMTALTRRQLLLMGLTSLIATANWLWARRHYLELETKLKAAAAPLSPP
jgi:amino acid transporter